MLPYNIKILHISSHFCLLWPFSSSLCSSQVKIGAVCPTELRAICEKGLLLLTITIPEMELCQIAKSLVVTLPLVGFLGFFMTGNFEPTITSSFFIF